MRRHGRFFQQDILTHCYQRTQDGGLIFYAYSDYLVWFTTLCTEARKRDVQILALCPMPDHVHLSMVASTQTEMARFMGEYSRQFTSQRNRFFGLKGELFCHRYGSAVKAGAQKGRTNLIYVWNNPVERQLVSKAEAYRWTFLAYAKSKHPFSEKLILNRASKAVRAAVGEVSAQFRAGKPLNYAQLQRLFKPLAHGEKLQLTDFIISTYNVMDYSAALQFFNGSYEQLLMATHSNTGSEYDLNEPKTGKSDKPYLEMTRLLMQQLQLEDIHDILRLGPEQKMNIFRYLDQTTSYPPEQIAKFLNIPRESILMYRHPKKR